MKSKPAFRVFLVVSSALLFATQLQAATYYWDTDGTTAGLGNTAGTWGNSIFLATVPGGILGGTIATTGPTTTGADVIYFGTNNLALGNTASTIGIVAGGVTINSIVFGAGQTTPVTLSGGGGSITLAGSTPTITVNNTSNTIGAVLAGSAGITKAGAGTLILSGANSFTGGVNLSSGTLQVGNGSSGSLIAQDLNFNGTSVFNLVGAAGGSTQAMGNSRFNAGDATVQSTYGGSGNTILSFSDFDLSSLNSLTGATANFVTSGGVNGTTNKITNDVLSGSSDVFLHKSLFFNGSSYAAYDSGGFMRAFRAGDESFVSIGAGADMGVRDTLDNVFLTGSLSAQGSTAVNTINLGANSIRFAGASTLQTNGLLSSGSSNATIGGGTTTVLQATNPGDEMVIRVNGISDRLTIFSNILGADGTSLTKSGAGELVLSGVNTFNGLTTINSGTLTVRGGKAIADNSSVSLANAAGTVFRLDNNETIGSFSGGGFSGGNVNVQGNTLTIDNPNFNSLTFGGTFSGTSSGGVTLNNGSLALTNRNTFAGTIRLLSNTQLIFAYGNDGSASPATVSSGGTISMAGGSTLLLNPTIQAAAGIGSSSMNASTGGFIYSNPINVSSGVATVRSGQGEMKWVLNGGVTGGASGSQSISIVQSIAQGINGERQSILFSGIMQNGSGGGSGALGVNVDFQAASGTSQDAYVNLSAQNTFTGPIAVSNTKGLLYTYGSLGGHFVIGGEISKVAFGARSVTAGTGFLGGGNYTNTITLAGGTVLDYLSNSNQILGGVISGRGNLAKEAGAGTLTLSAANTFSGTTTIGAGKIVMNNSLALQNSAYVTTGSNGSTIGLDVTGGLSSGSLTLGGLGGSVNVVSAFTAGYTGSVTNLTLNPQIGFSNTYSGVIANGSGAMTLTKNGLGTQILSNTNTYTGGTIVNAGTLQLNGAFNMLGTGTLAVNGGGTFSLTDSTARTTTVNGGVTLSSGANLGFDWVNAAVDSLSTTAIVTPTSGAVIGIAINPSGTPSGSGTLISAAAGSALNNANYYLVNASNYTATLGRTATTVTIGSYASATALTSIYWTGNKLAGTATAGVDNAWSLSSGAAGNWSSTALSYTTTGRTPGSTANVFFSNVQAGKTQQSTVLGANLSVSSLTIDDNTAVTIAGSNILTLSATSGTAGSVNQGTGVGTAGSAITVTANAANPTISTSLMLGASQTWNVASGKTLTVSGTVYGAANATSLTKADAGTLLLSGTNAFTGGLNINAGTVLLGSTGALNNTSNQENAVAFGSGSTGILALAGNSVTIANLNTSSTPGTTFVQNANGSSVGNAMLTVGNGLNLSGSYFGTLRDGTGGGSLTLIKSGLGSLVLSNNANSYTGATILNGGVLTTYLLANGGGNSAIGASSNAASNLILNGGTLQYAGFSDASIDRLFSLQSSSTIDSSGFFSLNFTNTGSIGFNGGTAAKTLTLTGSSSGNSSIAAAIGDNTGATSITKADDGIWALTGTNSYTGATSINGGTLIVSTLANGGSNSAIGAAGNIAGNLVLNGGTLKYTGAAVSTDRLFSVQSNSTVDSSGSGAINFTNTGNMGFNGGSDSRILTLDGSNTGNNTLAAIIGDNTGATSVTKNGNGTWVMSGTNTYTGATTINSGILRAGSAAGGMAFGNNSAVSLGGTAGSALDLNSFNQTIGSLAGGADTGGNVTLGTGTLTVGTDNTSTLYAGAISGTDGNLIKTGNGNLTLTGNSSYTGTTTVASGSLVINGAVASTSMVVNGNLSGSGSMANATISGSGSVNPGNSPGLLTGAALNPTSGLDFNFEFTAADTLPIWNNPTASLNDVLRLADAANPITASMTSTNLVSIFLNVGSIASGNVFTGGFYTDRTSSFLASISGANFQYYIADDVGAVTYNGNNYNIYSGPLSFTANTVAQTADFGSGNISGYTTQFTVGVSDPYLQWANGGGPSGNDDNGDGVTNGLAWLLGVPDPNTNARPYLPVSAVSAGNIRLYFNTLDTASRGNGSIKVQYSNDLGNTDSWASHQAEVPDTSSTVNGIVFTIERSGNYLIVEALIPASAASSSKKLFARVSATVP